MGSAKDPALVARIRYLIEDKQFTARQTAAEVGLTRCAVVGIANRRGFVFRRKQSESNGIPRPNQSRTMRNNGHIVRRITTNTQIPFTEPHVEIPDLATSCSLFALTSRTCPWPIDGTAPPFLYCGSPKELTVAFCPYHMRIGHVTEAPVKKSVNRHPAVRQRV